MKRQLWTGLALAAAGALALAGCSGGTSDTSNDGATGGETTTESFTIGINQLVQHNALDAAAEGFQAALADAGLDVTYDVQNANGEQSTAVTIANSFASQDLDLVLAIATPAAQATAKAITDTPVVFTAVTDAVSAELVDSNEAPGGNVTGTSDLAPIDAQLALLKELVPGAQTVGIVYASGEVNSQVQVDEALAVAPTLDLEIETKTVSALGEVQQAVEALGDVDAIYVPTDNLIVQGLASLLKVAEDKQIPVIAAEAGTVIDGAIATLGIDYYTLGYQAGEMAVKILTEGGDPATMAVEVAKEFSYVVNPAAAERMGVEIPQSILDEAEIVE